MAKLNDYIEELQAYRAQRRHVRRLLSDDNRNFW